MRPSPLSLNAYSNRTGPIGVSAMTPAPYPYPCPGFPLVPPGSPSTETPDFRSLPTSMKTHLKRRKLASAERSRARSQSPSSLRSRSPSPYTYTYYPYPYPPPRLGMHVCTGNSRL